MSDPLFYEREPRARKIPSPLMALKTPFAAGFLSIGTIIIIGLSIWFFYPSDNADSDILPIIKAQSDPIRFDPPDQENRFASGQESMIFETFDSAQGEKRIENLLKPSEIKQNVEIDREKLFAGLKPEIQVRATDMTPVKITESPFPEAPSQEETLESASNIQEQNPSGPSSDIMASNKIAIEKPETSETQTKSAASIGIFDTSSPLLSQEADNKQAAEMDKKEPAAGASFATLKTPEKFIPPTTPLSGTQAGNYFVQLASIRDPSRSKDAWNDLKKTYSFLETVSYRTESAVIEGKGTFYRIQAGPFSKMDADQLCNTIKARSGSCLIAKK